jgi:excisionase family DNA binding protein
LYGTIAEVHRQPMRWWRLQPLPAAGLPAVRRKLLLDGSPGHRLRDAWLTPCPAFCAVRASRQIVRAELRTVHTQLEAIADAVRQLSTADANPDELMTVKQVAETAKVAATTVRMWIHSGKLRAIRPGVGRGPGRTFRISRADLKEFVASVRERVPESEAERVCSYGATPGGEAGISDNNRLASDFRYLWGHD